MRTHATLLLLGAALAGTGLPAQETTVATAARVDTTAADSAAPKPAAGKKTGTISESVLATLPTITMQHFRPVDQRGLNQFETTKEPGAEYKGFALMIDAAFTQQFQGLGHENTAAPRVVNGVNQNQLIQFGHGFFFGGLAVRNV